MPDKLPEETPKPRFELEKVDTEKMADELAKRDTSTPEPLPPNSKLVDTCPKCGLPSLFYNERDRVYECLNKWCPRKTPPTVSQSLTDYFLHSH